MSTFELGLQPSRTAVEGIGWAAKRSKWESLLVAVAYATTSGSQQLVGELDAQWEGFQDSKKVFLVGLDFGLTEPEAVDYLAALPGAIVRLWKPEQTIRANLKPARRYHPKVYALANTGSMRNATGAAGIVGSANLTGSGLTANIETFAAFDVSYVDEVGANWIAELRKLELIAAGMPKATEQILKQYALIRRRQPAFARGVAEPPPGVVGPREELPSELLRALRSARFFWTQTLNIIPNRGRGRAGNQVDLKKGARAFFGSRVPLSEPINTPLADIEIVKDGSLEPCHVRFGHNGMDKVNLPIPKGSARYDQRFLLWKRLGPRKFELVVQTAAPRWIAASTREGALFGYTTGQRQWGFFNDPRGV